MNIQLANKSFEVTAVISGDKVNVNILHKGRFQKFQFSPKKPWKKLTPKRATEVLELFVMQAPVNRVKNLFQYKTCTAVGKLRNKIA